MSNEWNHYIHINCRTCAHSTAKQDSTWRCERHEVDGIPVEFQREGCDSHVLHPDLVPWQRDESDNPHEAVYIIDGKRIRNGEKAPGVYASTELLSNAAACGQPDAEALRVAFNGEIVG